MSSRAFNSLARSALEPSRRCTNPAISTSTGLMLANRQASLSTSMLLFTRSRSHCAKPTPPVRARKLLASKLPSPTPTSSKLLFWRNLFRDATIKKRSFIERRVQVLGKRGAVQQRKTTTPECNCNDKDDNLEYFLIIMMGLFLVFSAHPEIGVETGLYIVLFGSMLMGMALVPLFAILALVYSSELQGHQAGKVQPQAVTEEQVQSDTT